MPSEKTNDHTIYDIFKRAGDIFISFAGLIILLPLIIYVAIRVKLSSVGPVIYAQERVGFKGRKFLMLKFRSMYSDAEKSGPQLSAHNDKRITSWGRIMRKWKLDELPQLLNVFKGDMSIVGPRPEREYYLYQLDPLYVKLSEVRPGITSLGMIKFGYADSIDQMNRRMKYDLEYLDKRSFLLDIKILISTLRMVLRAGGR